MTSIRCHAGGLLLALACPAPAAAQTTHRVPQDFATIQAALTAAASGDRVVVGAGTWVENIDFQGKNISLESVGGASVTTIRPNGGTVVTVGPGGAVIGFTIAGGTGSFGAGMDVAGTGTRVALNVFQDNQAPIGSGGAAIYGNGASPVIERNHFRRNTCDTQFIAGVVSFVNMSSPVIASNVFEDNTCQAVNLVLPDGAGPRVMNNTFVANRVGVRVYRAIPTATQVYRNNIIVGNATGVLDDVGTNANNPTWQNNLVFGNGTNYSGLQDQTGVQGNISVDPQFRNAQMLDYRLASGSPAIDAGTALGAPVNDFDGAARPADGNGDGVAAFDIGAFEAPAVATREVLIGPPAGIYFRTQRVDLTLAVQDAARAIAASVRLDGQDVTGLFFACAAFGTSGGSTTLRCPNVPVAILAPGAHTWTVRIDFNDGTSVSQAVSWTVRAATEP